MKGLIVFLFVCISFFISCENPSDLVYPTKTGKESVKNDTVKMQYQINTTLVHAQSYYIFADFGDGYLYQCIAETIYRGDNNTADNLQWTFSKNQITSNTAKFKIIAHWDNEPYKDIQLGVIYFSN